MQLTVFFDFLCPYAWRASRWLDMVVEQRPEVVIDWRYFSLEQVNTPADSAWKVWEQDGDGYARHDGTTTWGGLHGFWAAEAVRRQSPALFSAFRTAVYDARHQDKIALNERAPLAAIAAQCGVDMAQFAVDTHDKSLLTVLQRDHEYARAQYTCFGVPTLCFDDRNAVYVKLSEIIDANQVLPLFDDIASSFTKRPWLVELKRPNP
jgi:predicted DsbA family dithiol-disulfide isomerase